jgi:hypothetical protein
MGVSGVRAAEAMLGAPIGGIKIMIKSKIKTAGFPTDLTI